MLLTHTIDTHDTISHKKRYFSLEIEFQIRDILKDSSIAPYVIELLVAQAKHESGEFKNNLTRYNNIFARHYHKSDTFATSAGARAEGHTRFAIYPSIRNAVLSQLWYLKKRKYSFKWSSPYQFCLELKQKHYYEASVKSYTSAITHYMQKPHKYENLHN